MVEVTRREKTEEEKKVIEEARSTTGKWMGEEKMEDIEKPEPEDGQRVDLKINQIPYKFLMFKQHNTYLTKNYIDCTDLIKTYTVGKQHHCKNKLKAQILIAKHVEKHI